MVTLNSEQVAEKLNIGLDNFLNNNSYYIKKLSNQGYSVKKIGTGVNALYEIEINEKNKKLSIKEYINQIFDLRPKYPLIFYKYLYFIKTNDISYLSDADIAIKLGYTKNSRKEIQRCKQELIDNEYLVVDGDSIRYFIIRYDENGRREKKEIDSYLFSEMLAWAEKLKESGCEDVWDEVRKEFGGYPSRVYKRVVAEKLRQKLNGKEYAEMLDKLKINWRKKHV